MKRTQYGIALVLVLWVVALLSVIAGNFAFTVRTETLSAHNHYRTVQARSLADAGVQRAIYELENTSVEVSAWKGDGVPHVMDLGGGRVVVTVLDESGKIDLNTAQDILLRNLLRTVGLGDEQSGAVLDAILDWRDADSLRRPRGAEEGDYRAAGRKYRPANTPFETMEELQRVLGVTPALYGRMASALTVYSKQGGVNTAFAPREVLLALPGADPAQVDAYLALRRATISPQVAPPFPAAAAFPAGASNVFGVRSEARLADGTVFVREAVFQLISDVKRPAAILSWREGTPAAGLTEQEENRANAG